MFFILCLVSEKIEANFNFKKNKIKENSTTLALPYCESFIVRAHNFWWENWHINHRSML